MRLYHLLTTEERSIRNHCYVVEGPGFKVSPTSRLIGHLTSSWTMQYGSQKERCGYVRGVVIWICVGCYGNKNHKGSVCSGHLPDWIAGWVISRRRAICDWWRPLGSKLEPHCQHTQAHQRPCQTRWKTDQTHITGGQFCKNIPVVILENKLFLSITVNPHCKKVKKSKQKD